MATSRSELVSVTPADPGPGVGSEDTAAEVSVVVLTDPATIRTIFAAASLPRRASRCTERAESLLQRARCEIGAVLAAMVFRDLRSLVRKLGGASTAGFERRAVT